MSVTQRILALIAEGDDRIWAILPSNMRALGDMRTLVKAVDEVEAMLAQNKQTEVDDDRLIELLAIRLQKRAEP